MIVAVEAALASAGTVPILVGRGLTIRAGILATNLSRRVSSTNILSEHQDPRFRVRGFNELERPFQRGFRNASRTRSNFTGNPCELNRSMQHHLVS